jgi:serine/threonine-protein kinase
VLDKAKPLGQVLGEQGALSAERRALLEALVQEHLKQHENDPRHSLAALSSADPLPYDLRQIADAAVQASLDQVAVAAAPSERLASTPHHSAALDRAGGNGVSGPAAPLALPPDVRYRTVRPHAKGGLGEVFVAHDEELKREVALKEIQDRFAGHADSRSRFLLEAEVTGVLEHPGIVPVYGLGHYADGRPFHAMRFIKGDSLKDAIERFHQADRRGRPEAERSLALRGLLGRFVDVCQVIAYAHSRGVLHSDLKPANVMLGKYGETLVVDWGLAKVLGKTDVETTEGVMVGSGDAALTQAGKALGTPAYMSPAQAAGRLHRLGPASDVYSLGATLYCLLAGQVPFAERDAGGVLGKVQRGDFPPPRQVNRRVPAALEAVCLKAMALNPRGTCSRVEGDGCSGASWVRQH